jgi:hypothetical protein
VAKLAHDAGWVVTYQPAAVVRYQPLSSWDQLRADHRRTAVRSRLPHRYQPIPFPAVVRGTLLAATSSPLNCLAWVLCRLRLAPAHLLPRTLPDAALAYWNAVPSHSPTPASPGTTSQPAPIPLSAPPPTTLSLHADDAPSSIPSRP